jgi:hypothetical protein
MLDRRGAQLLLDTGRDRYGRDVDEIRRHAEAAESYAGQLEAIASAMDTCELESPERLLVRGRDVGPSRVGAKAAQRLRSMQGGLELLVERDRELLEQPRHPEADHAAEETELESQPAPAPEHTTEGPVDGSDEQPADAGQDGAAEAAQPIDLAFASSPPADVVIVRRLLAQVGDDAPAGTAARAQAAAAQLPADRLRWLLANGPWNRRSREWGELASAQRADYLVGCLEQLRDEAGRASEIGTRTVRAADNDPANDGFLDTPADSQSAGSATLGPP